MSAAVLDTRLSAPRRQLRLVSQVALYEMRKATIFRTGFLIREVMRGMNRPVVMIFVYLAILKGSGKADIQGFTFPELVRYLILVATFQKVIIHERSFDLSDQIFKGFITKFFVMPVRYFTLVLGRFVQFTALQLAVAISFWLAGALLLPSYWPTPASPLALAEASILLLLGSYCFLLMFTIIHSLAFWLDVVWTLLVGSRFVTDFVSGSLIPVAIMPAGFRGAFSWLFPYWTLSAPIEIFMGKLGTPDFLRGLAVLGVTALLLETARRVAWGRGVRQYSGSGM
ncbi:MAG: hypothetical protein U0166_24135 [Acidobacteriota bacterium]